MIVAWFSGRSAVDLLVLTAAALAAMTGIWKTVWRCIRFFQRIETALRNVEAQLYPNGGSTLRDQSNRIEVRVARIEQRLEGGATDGTSGVNR